MLQLGCFTLLSSYKFCGVFVANQVWTRKIISNLFDRWFFLLVTYWTSAMRYLPPFIETLNPRGWVCPDNITTLKFSAGLDYLYESEHPHTIRYAFDSENLRNEYFSISEEIPRVWKPAVDNRNGLTSLNDAWNLAQTRREVTSNYYISSRSKTNIRG